MTGMERAAVDAIVISLGIGGVFWGLSRLIPIVEHYKPPRWLAITGEVVSAPFRTALWESFVELLIGAAVLIFFVGFVVLLVGVVGWAPIGWFVVIAGGVVVGGFILLLLFCM